jgi:selenide,water dikinase
LNNKRIIALMGIGHTNAHIVREWAIDPIPDCRLVCISKFPFATYSGMLPGTLAKQFEPSKMEIQLAPLAERAGAELILAEVVGLEIKTRRLLFTNRDPLQFDALSVGVGSMPSGWNDFESPSLIPIKPMQTFVDRLENRLQECGPSPRCVVVGGGVAGVEVALCLHARLTLTSPRRTASIAIVTSGDEIVGGMSDQSRRALSRLLVKHSIEVVNDFRVTNVSDSSVEDEVGNREKADVVVWATGAAPPPILSELGLPTDARGFLATTPTLRSKADVPVFAVGDSGTIESDPAPKAGVFAVRQAPVLWHNLQAIFDPSQSMKEFHSQRDFLKILNTGEGKALLEYRSWMFHARWCWWLKCWIDKAFVRKYQF